MWVRGIRGAVTVEQNKKESILNNTKELLLVMQRENGFKIAEIASIFFSVTTDLNDAFPAAAARQLGWNLVPLFDMQEIPVPHSLSKCIRVLIMINCQKNQEDIIHCYLKGAKTLRKDLMK